MVLIMYQSGPSEETDTIELFEQENFNVRNDNNKELE